METPGTRRNPLLLAFGVIAAVVVIGGLLLGFFGVGAELAKPKTVLVTIRNKTVEPEIAKQIHVGDALFTDTAGIEIGKVVKVSVIQQPRAVGDAQGKLHMDADPLSVQVDTTVEARGREGNGMVLLDTQVVQAGQFLNLISQRYYLSGTVVSIDVR
jgi:hypothetical protein